MLLNPIMRNLVCILLCLCALMSCSWLHDCPEQEFFKFDLQRAEEDCACVDLTLDVSDGHNVGGTDCIVIDSLVVSLSRDEYLFHISDLESGELVGSFCRRGRAGNEPLSALPLSELYEKDGDLCADVCSFMNSKLFVWNVTQSIRQNKDVYNQIIDYSTWKDDGFGEMSWYRLPGNGILSCNPMQDAKSADVVAAPTYMIFNMEKGIKTREFDLFKFVEKKTVNPMFPSKVFLSGVDCISPSKDRLFVGMSYMPVYCILDIESGKAKGFKVDGMQSFSPYENRWHFADAQADDNFVYVLYSGGLMFSPDGTDLPGCLYVMDWGGSIKLKCKLNHRFTGLNLDGGILYLTHFNGDMAKIETTVLATMFSNPKQEY